MAQPLLANDRVKIDYYVDGQPHVVRMYCNRGTTSGSTYNLLARDLSTQLDWQPCIQQAWNCFVGLFYAGTPTPIATLESLSGSVWNPIDAFTLVNAGAGGSYNPASQATWVVRDTAFKKIHLVLMEHRLGYVGHAGNGLGLAAITDVVTRDITGADGDAFGLFQWWKSRGNRYILPSGAIAGLTFDLNDKMKRRRNLE
jgi:hypothetical protein